MIKTTKQVSARRQIGAAIQHFERKDYECAITLAGAGEGQIKEPSIATHFFRVLREHFPSDEVNKSIHWMKHPSGPDGAEITEQEVVVTVVRAIQKYVAAYKVTHPDFQKFGEWAMQKGYTKGPLAVKDEGN
jgi:hypothetical protein